MYKIGILAYDEVEELDLVGPFETTSYINKIKPLSTSVSLVSQNGGEIRCFNGLRILADYSFDNAPAFDILIVPGGKGRITEMKNDNILNYIKKVDGNSKFTCSVCTGAFLLCNAGLLVNRKATTYHTALEELKEYDAIPVKKKVVQHGKYITSAGVSSGIELGLFIIRELFGLDLAHEVSMKIEYDVDFSKL